MSLRSFKVIIWGTGSLSVMVQQTVKDYVDIVGLTSSNNEDEQNCQKYINKLDLNGQEYDYLIIATQYIEEVYAEIKKLNINFEKVIDYYSYYNNNFKYLKLLEYKETIDTIFMGMSYAEKAYNYKVLGDNTFNLANSSEDIYYSYGILKKVLKESNNIHTVILDLPYYFMNYNMSKTKNMKVRGNLYINLLQDSHEYAHVKFNDSMYKNFKSIFNENEIGLKVKSSLIGKYRREFKIEKELSDSENIKYNPNYEKYYNRSFKKTQKENVEILTKFISLCVRNSIKLIITVSPSLMREHREEVKVAKLEFYKIIEQCKKEYKFEFIDFFSDQTFILKDFKDYTHLNYEGSKKISNKIRGIL